MCARPIPSHYNEHAVHWNDLGDSSSNSHSHNEDDEDPDDVEGPEWGLEKGMELFEVSAKDDTGAKLAYLSLLLRSPTLTCIPSFRCTTAF